MHISRVYSNSKCTETKSHRCFGIEYTSKDTPITGKQTVTLTRSYINCCFHDSITDLKNNDDDSDDDEIKYK